MENNSHRFNYKCNFFIISLLAASIISACDTIYDNLRRVGFFEIENSDLLRQDYTNLYREYDDFIDLVSTDKNFFDILIQSEKEFVANHNHNLRYCAAPPSYRNPETHLKKINNRIYFQYIKEHFDLIKQSYPDIMRQAQNFFNHLDHVDQMSKKHFTKIIAELELQCPQISKVFYGDNNDLTVVTKIVRYKKTQDWHEKPHFDKSGLTIILDNDDNHQSLMLCKDTEKPTKTALELPVRRYATSNNSTSALLIGGLCLNALNYNIKPTLHYVGPIKNEYRHSIISFLLIPNIDTSTMKTEFVEN